MLMKKSLLCVCLMLQVLITTAQKTINEQQNPKQDISLQNSISTLLPIGNGISFKSAADIKNWFIQNQNANTNFDIRAIDSNIDIAGNTHIRLKQYYHNIPIEASMLHLHCKGNTPHSFNGTFYPNIIIDLSQQITQEQAFQIAKSIFPSNTVFAWEENTKKLLHTYGFLETDSIVSKPKSEYTIVPSNNPEFPNDLRLAHQFTICSLSPFSFKKVYVDAQNGSILLSKDLIQQNDTKGIAHTKYYGIKEIVCDSLDTNLYKLIERTRGADSIYVLSIKAPAPYWLYDDDNDWNNVNSLKDEAATDVHWGLEQTYDYFKSRYKRNSYDGKGHEISGIIHSGTKENTAYWNGAYGRMVLGDGDDIKYDAWTSIDIVGHEFTHGLTISTANLYYEKESGALNESFSDIFGKCVEHYALPDSFTWGVAQKIAINGYPAYRSFSDPNSRLHPKYYRGKYYDDTTNFDSYGVHTNSSVQNYWFYLLSEGGMGLREADSKPYTVNKIGIDTAGIIAYYTLTNYLTPTSKFIDAAKNSIAATRLLFGDSSRLVHEVIMAWYAVGVLNTTAIEETPLSQTNLQFQIYPNPTNGNLNISSSVQSKNLFTAKIYDLLGHELFRQQLSFSNKQSTVKLDIPNGSYLLELQDESGNVQRERILIQ